MSLCIQRKTDDPLLKRNFLDLEMYIRVDIPDYGKYNLLAALVNDTFGADEDEIFSRAMAKLEDDINIIPMEHVIGNIFPLGAPKQLILTTKSGERGASVICIKDLLRKIADMFDSNLVIFPSSIHECIISIDDGLDMEECHEIVRGINQRCVDEEDILSDHAYFYNKDTEKITW